MFNRINRQVIRQGLLCLMVATLLLISACGSASKDEDTAMAVESQATADQFSSELSENITQTDEAVSESKSLQVNEAASQTNTGNIHSSIPSGGMEQKLIYRGDITMEVQNYENAQMDIYKMIEMSGGYILSFSDQESENERGGQFTFKIPAKGFMDFTRQLESMEHQHFEQKIEGQDVTEEYVDVESRLKAKKVVEARLLAFMDKASNTQELLQFSNQLAEVQEQIEQIQGRKRYLDQNVAFSTVNIRLYETYNQVVPIQSVSEISYMDQIVETLSTSWNGVVGFLKGLILVILAMLPILLVIAVLGIPSWWWYWRRRRQRSKSSATIDKN